MCPFLEIAKNENHSILAYLMLSPSRGGGGALYTNEAASAFLYTALLKEIHKKTWKCKNVVVKISQTSVYLSLNYNSCHINNWKVNFLTVYVYVDCRVMRRGVVATSTYTGTQLKFCLDKTRGIPSTARGFMLIQAYLLYSPPSMFFLVTIA